METKKDRKIEKDRKIATGKSIIAYVETTIGLRNMLDGCFPAQAVSKTEEKFERNIQIFFPEIYDDIFNAGQSEGNQVLLAKLEAQHGAGVDLTIDPRSDVVLEDESLDYITATNIRKVLPGVYTKVFKQGREEGLQETKEMDFEYQIKAERLGKRAQVVAAVHQTTKPTQPGPPKQPVPAAPTQPGPPKQPVPAAPTKPPVFETFSELAAWEWNNFPILHAEFADKENYTLARQTRTRGMTDFIDALLKRQAA